MNSWTKGKPKGSRTPIIERLMARVTVADNGCWETSGGNNGRGYAVISSGGAHGRQMYAHRVAYEHHVGPIPDGLVLDHLCRNPCCCNPEHLEPVTQRENWRRGVGPFTRAAVATTCAKGHDYDEANTYRKPNTGYRSCRKCAALRRRELRRQRGKATA